MKLHLPKGLFSALRACVLSVPALFATAGSGAISTAVTAVAITWSIAPQAQATDTTYIYTGNAATLDGAGALGSMNEGNTWTAYTYAGANWNPGSATNNNVIRFMEATAFQTLTGVAMGAQKTLSFAAGNIGIGGFIVDTGAIGYSYVASASGWDRHYFIQGTDSADADSHAKFDINEDFSFSTNGGTGTISRDLSLAADADMTVAADKTFTINGNLASGAGKTLYLAGGGKLRYNDTGSASTTAAAFDWNITEGSTLELGGNNISIGTAVLGSGDVHMLNGKLSVAVENSTLTANLIVGAGGGELLGTGTTLTGSLTYTDHANSKLNLNGSFSLADLTLDLGLGDLTAGEYILMTREAGTTGLDVAAADIDIVGLDPLSFDGIEWDGDNLVLTVTEFTGAKLTHTDGDIIWSTDVADMGWTLGGGTSSFNDGDIVTIGGDDSTGGTVDIKDNVNPVAVTVTGTGTWVFSTTNNSSITGTGSLTKSGSSVLDIQTSNSYSGGTTLSGGTLILGAADAVGTGLLSMSGADTVLVLADAGGLGDANIVYGGGVIKYEAGITTDISGDISFADGVTALSVDLNGNDITWATDVDKNLTLTSTVAGGILNYSADLALHTITLGEGSTLVATTSTNASNNQGVVLAGSGTLVVDHDANFFIHSTAGFTGTVNAMNGATSVLFSRHNSSADRFLLQTASTAAAATHFQAITVGTSGWNSNETLYLKGLTGYSNLTTSYDTPTNRGLNVEMVEDNTYHGDLRSANGATDARWGTWTIGSKQDDTLEGIESYTFTWTGQGRTGTTEAGVIGSLGTNALLHVLANSTMELATDDAGTDGGNWLDEITLDADANLLISRTDAVGFVQNATGNVISGEGAVQVSGTANLTGANTYSGGTTVLDGGRLTTSSVSALSTGSISVETGGTLNTPVGLTTVAGQTITNAGTLNLGGTLTLLETITNTGTVNLLAGTIFDLTDVTPTSEGVYTLFTDGGTIDFSALSATGVLGFENLLGVETSGIVWQLHADGTLTYEADTNSLFYSAGGAFLWNVGSSVDGGATFANGNSLVLSTADVAATLAGDVEAASLTVEGINASLTGDGFTLTTSSITLTSNATLSIEGLDTVGLDTKYFGAAGNSLIFDFGAGNTRTLNEQLIGFEGFVVVESGDLTISLDAQAKLMSMESFTVLAGASLTSRVVTFAEASGIDLNLEGGDDASSVATWNTGNASFHGDITATGSTLIDANDITYLYGNVSSEGDMRINVDTSGVYVSGGLAGSGTIVKTGAGNLNFITDNQVVSHTGTLDIQEGVLTLGNSFDSDIDVYLKEIILREGTTLNTSLSAESIVDSVTLVMGGATINHGNMGGYGDLIVQWDALRIIDDSTNTIDFDLKATYEFNMLTGNGDLAIAGAATEATLYRLTFAELRDYTGTFTGVNNAQFSLYMNSAHQSAGNSAVINDVVINSTNFLKTGEGSLSVGEGFVNTGRFKIEAGSLTVNKDISSTDSFGISGGSLTVLGTLSTDNFSNTGAGTVNIGTLALAENGLMQMNYAGDMTLGAFTAAGDIRLSYDSTLSKTWLFSAADAQLAGVESIVVNLMDYTAAQLQAGINLGIYEDFDQANIAVLGLENYDISANAEGYYVLTSTDTLNIGWDANWGTEELAKRPISVPQAADLGNVQTYLYGNADYTVDGSTVIELTGGGGAEAQVFGGKNYAWNVGAETIETDVWIKASGGEFVLLAGGSMANNWGGTNELIFVGNTHIEVNQTDAAVDLDIGHIVGGSLREGGHTIFTGDTYISVFTDSVDGSIIGAGTSRHADGSLASRKTTFRGDTNIYIYTPLTVSDAASTGESMRNGTIVGGHSWAGGATATFTLTGNTNVTINLRDYTGGSASMVKSVIGGGIVGAGSHSLLTGDSHVDITGHENVTFTSMVMGGIHHISGTPTSTLDGHTYVSISGDSNFMQRIVGASNHFVGTATIKGSTNLTISDADQAQFSQLIMGGFNQHAGTTTIEGGTNVNVHNIGEANFIYGASLVAAGNSTVRGGSSVSVGHGNFNNVVVGFRKEGTTASTLILEGESTLSINNAAMASYAAIGGSHVTASTGNSITQLDKVTINVTGATSASNVFGGSSLHTADNTVSSGDVSITVTDDTSVTSNIAGGHYVQMSNQGALSTGDVSIEVKGTADVANVYGGHIIEGAGTVTSLTLGDAEVKVGENATVTNVYGGSHLERAVAATQGVLTVYLEGGASIAGNVYAAGNLEAAASVVTESTSVILASMTQFTGASTIVSGGYQGNDSAASVTGTRSLKLNEVATSYDFGATVSFHDFDVIEVVDGDSSLVTHNALSEMADKLTKTGEGSLALANINHGATSSLLISEGTVLGAGTLSSVEVTSWGTLSIAAGGMTVNTDLTLSNKATLGYSAGTTGLNLAGSLALDGTGSKINLSITGLGTGDYREVLFSGIADYTTQLGDFTFEELLNGAQGFAANEYFTLDGADLANDVFVVYDAANEEVYLTNRITKTIVWNASVDGWLDANAWSTEDTPPVDTNFAPGDSVIFEGGITDTVAVASDVLATNLTLRDAGSDYSFAGSNITVTANFKLIGDVSATFASLTLTDADVSLDADTLLTIYSDVTMGSLLSTGEIVVGRDLANADLSLSTATTAGGQLTVKGDLTLAGDATESNSFALLNVTGNVTNSSILNVLEGSTIGGALSGGALSIGEAQAAETTTSIGSITDALDSFENAGANNTVSIGSALEVTGAFSNEHIVNVAGDVTLGEATSTGGTLSAANVTLTGDNSFTKLTTTGGVSGATDLSLGDGSSIAGTLAGAGLNLSSSSNTTAVQIGAISDTLASLEVTAGKLVVDSSLSVAGVLSNKGELEVKGDKFTLKASTTEGGVLTAKDVELQGDDAFTTIKATGALTSKGDLSLASGSSTAQSVTGVENLTITSGSLLLTLNNDTSFTSLAGAGSLIMGGNLSLSAGGSIGTVIMGSELTLGGSLAVTNTLSMSAAATITANYVIDKDAGFIVTGKLMSAISINFVISDNDISSIGLGADQSVTLLDVTSGSSLTSFTINNSDVLNIGSYQYVISEAADGDIILTASLSGNSWQDGGNGEWGNAGSWAAGIPTATDPAIFSGKGPSAVSVTSYGIASSILVDVEAGSATGSYAFSGAKLTTGSLTVRNGGLSVSNEISVVTDISGTANSSLGELIVDTEGNLSILAGGSITAATGSLAGNALLDVSVGASLTITGDMDVSAGSVNAFENAGVVTVQGALTSTVGVTLENDGTLKVGDGSDISGVSGVGTFSVLADSSASVDELTQGLVNIASGSALLSLEAEITKLDNMGTFSADDLTILGDESTLGSANVGNLTLDGTDHIATSLKVDNVFLGELSTTAKLSVSSISELTTNDAKVGLDFDMAAPTITGGSYSFSVMNKNTSGSLDWDSFTLSAETYGEFNDLFMAGMDALLDDSDGSLSVVVTEATDRVWSTSNLVAATPGLENVDPPMHYDVIDATDKIVGYDALDGVARVIIDEDVTVDLTGITLDPTDNQGLIMRNISGSAGTTMTIVGDTAADSLVTLYTEDGAISAAAQSSMVVTDSTLQVEGLGETVLGSLDMTDSKFVVHQGGSISLGSARFDNSQVIISQAAVTRAATPGKSTVTVGDVSFENGSDLAVEMDGIYHVTGTLDIDGTSDATVKSGGELIVDGKTTVDSATLTVEDGGKAELGIVELLGTASLEKLGSSSIFIVEQLSGGINSSVNGAVTVTGQGGKFEGSFTTLSEVTVEAGAAQEFNVDANLYITGGLGSDITLNYISGEREELGRISTTGSHTTLKGSTLGESLTLGSSSSMTGGSLSLTLDADNLSKLLMGDATASMQQFFTGADLTLDGVHVLVSALDASGAEISSIDLSGLSDGTILANVGDNVTLGSESNTVILQGTLAKYFTDATIDSLGNIVVNLSDASYNGLGITHNGKTGTSLLSKALIELNPQMSDKDSSLAKVLNDMDQYLSTGNAAAADKLAAAVAGASVTTMGSAMLSSVERQLQGMRNRSLSTAGESTYYDGYGANYSAWIAAEGSYSTFDSDGTSSGYDYSDMGGSFGVNVEMDSSVTLGFAFTSLYAEVDSNAADQGEGKLNTNSLSAYARYTHDRWSHSFVGSLTMADASLDRTVYHSTGSYQTEGDSDGLGLGLMYEVAYSYVLDEDAGMAWQPVFNVSFVHASLDGYTESGGNAALKVGDQDSTYVTFGLGGRFEVNLGENVFNRSGVFSSRAMLKVDAGDRHTEADVSILGASGAGTVVGAEAGAFGIELGAGLSVPVGTDSGAIFIDASCELRSDEREVNASMGYRFNF